LLNGAALEEIIEKD